MSKWLCSLLRHLSLRVDYEHERVVTQSFTQPFQNLSLAWGGFSIQGWFINGLFNLLCINKFPVELFVHLNSQPVDGSSINKASVVADWLRWIMQAFSPWLYVPWLIISSGDLISLKYPMLIQLWFRLNVLNLFLAISYIFPLFSYITEVTCIYIPLVFIKFTLPRWHVCIVCGRHDYMIISTFQNSQMKSSCSKYSGSEFE